MTTTISRIEPKIKLQTLLGYARRGWHIFPCYEPAPDDGCSCEKEGCRNQGKHPRIKGGLNAGTTDPQRITAWHERWPDANWAVSCGLSGITVLDVDPRNGGDDSLAEIEREHPLPDTVRANTGGGGQHYFFAGSVASAVLEPGLECKSQGGYVIIYPSWHKSGAQYTWDAGSPTEFADVPQWIRGRARARGNPALSAGPVLDGWVARAFEAAGWLYRALPGGVKAAVRCPWDAEHSGGSRGDTSTVVFAPYPGHRIGKFHCSHAHCSSRTLTDVVHALPASARAAATEATGVTPPMAPDMRAVQIETAIPAGSPWRDSLRWSADGSRLTRDHGNLALLLANMPDWAGCLGHDAFADRIEWLTPVPELPGMEHGAPAPGDELRDVHLLYVRHWFARRWGITMGADAAIAACEQAARANSRHPVREYLESTEWDRVPRAARWLSQYCGAEDTEYAAAVGRWWLISAVARAMRPGCQVDHMLVLEGLQQGEGKSSALALLCGHEWFLPALPDIRNKDALMALRGIWIVEVGEMDAFRAQEASRVKDFVSQRYDRYRPAYGRCTIEVPRTCVFAGTTNDDRYLQDPSGARRFWPVRVSTVDTAGLARDRDQIWAEAVHYFRCDERWWPDTTGTLTEQIREQQADRYVGDVWERAVLRWAETQTREFGAQDVLQYALELPARDWTRGAQTRVGIILRAAGYTSRRAIVGSYGRQTVYGTPKKMLGQ